MNSDPITSEALNRLQRYVEKSAFKGFDPYDFQNSRFPIKGLPHTLQFVLSQINKRSPYNFRKLIGIEKNYHTKAMGLLLSSYCNLCRLRSNNANLFYENVHESQGFSTLKELMAIGNEKGARGRMKGKNLSLR